MPGRRTALGGLPRQNVSDSFPAPGPRGRAAALQCPGAAIGAAKTLGASVPSRATQYLKPPSVLPLAAPLRACQAVTRRGLAAAGTVPQAAAGTLTAPAVAAASLDGDRIRLQWAPSVGAIGYSVHCGPHSDGESAQPSLGAGGTGAAVSVPRPGGVRYCFVRAVAGGTGSRTPSAGVRVPRPVAPWQELRLP